MNIFALSDNPTEAAQFMCDKHIRKMIIETAQMLSTACWYHNKNVLDKNTMKLYKPTHVNHPCNKWVRENDYNWLWLYCHWLALDNEYIHRFGKRHGSNPSNDRLRLIEVYANDIPTTYSFTKATPPPQAMPWYCKVSPENSWENTVKAYREYYIIEKNDIAEWNTARKEPHWW